MKITTLFLLLCLSLHATAQNYTKPAQFSYRVDTSLVYGTAVNYTGHVDTLKLDLYKPLGDNNPHRPLAVLVHGGSWLTGCKTDMTWLAKELVGRGYAVAAVNYRLGWHKAATVAVACGTQDFPDVFPNEYSALYAADSCEIIRAIYRGQQDVKGAIRWLKARHGLDSTATNAVLVGGESAGAFVSMATGLLDRPEEKPDCCNAIGTAPAPSANTLNLTTLNCIPKIWSIDANTRQRPDLGPVDGTMNTGNGYDAGVIGVIDLFGGVPAIALPQNWLAGPNQPALYLYHQTCDAVVPSGYGQPFYPYSGVCNQYANCSPWHQYTPHVYGSAAIGAYLASLANPPLYTTELVYCDPFNTDLGIIACLAFANNGGYHFVANRVGTAQKIADFFCPVVAAKIGGACLIAVEEVSGLTGQIRVANPVAGKLSVFSTQDFEAPLVFGLYDLSGRMLWSDRRPVSAGQYLQFELPELAAGMYVLRVEGKAGVGVWKVIF
jgi:hypothetical protein